VENTAVWLKISTQSLDSSGGRRAVHVGDGQPAEPRLVVRPSGKRESGLLRHRETGGDGGVGAGRGRERKSDLARRGKHVGGDQVLAERLGPGDDDVP